MMGVDWIGSRPEPRAWFGLIALCRAGDPLDGLDPDDGRDDRVLKAVVGRAQVFLHGLCIEPTGNLLGGGDGELVTEDLNEAPALELDLEELALGLGALQDGVGL